MRTFRLVALTFAATLSLPAQADTSGVGFEPRLTVSLLVGPSLPVFRGYASAGTLVALGGSIRVGVDLLASPAASVGPQPFVELLLTLDHARSAWSAAYVGAAVGRLGFRWGRVQPYLQTGLGLARWEEIYVGNYQDGQTTPVLSLAAGTSISLAAHWVIDLELLNFTFAPYATCATDGGPCAIAGLETKAVSAFAGATFTFF